MVELGKLEGRHDEFAKRNTRIVAVSLDSVADSQEMQKKKFPHLVIVSDAEESLARAAAVIAPQHTPQGGDTLAPTTVFIDPSGQVRGDVFRPERYINRQSPDEVLKMIDAQLHSVPSAKN